MLSLVRLILMSNDAEKYFEHSYENSFKSIDLEDFEALAEAFGKEKLAKLSKENGIEIVNT